MTKAQHQLYLREWGKAFKAHWTGVKGGELLARPDRRPHQMRERVLAQARRMAAANPEDQRLSADCVRHACTVVALGRDKGSWSFTNRDLDRVLGVLRQLSNELDLTSAMVVDRSDAEKAVQQDDTGVQVAGDRRRVSWAISKIDLPKGYIEQICRDKFGTSNWRSLPDLALTQLLVTCKARVIARQLAAVVNSKTTAPT